MKSCLLLFESLQFTEAIEKQGACNNYNGVFLVSMKSVIYNEFNSYFFFIQLNIPTAGRLLTAILLIDILGSSIKILLYLFTIFCRDRCRILLLVLSEFYPLQPGVAFLYPLKTSENFQLFRFSDVFRGQGMDPLQLGGEGGGVKNFRKVFAWGGGGGGVT